MTRKRRRRKARELIPRRGPAVNLRPAGAHGSAKHYNRKKVKIALQEELEGDSFIGSEAAVSFSSWWLP